MTAPNQHALYAPSSAHRWTQCTASAEAIAKLPPQEEGDAAKEGTAAHEELERVLKGGAPDPVHPAAYIVSLAVDFIRQLPPGKLWVEQRVELTKHIWGRCDVAHYDPASEILTVLDLKNGFVGVDAKDNEQLMIYAAAAIFTYNLSAKYFRLVVVQPNDFRPGPRVKQYPERAEDWPKCTVDALYEFANGVAAIPTSPLTFKAGSWCRYCPLFGKCEPTRDLLAHLSVAMQHSPDEVPAATRATYMALRKPLDDWFKGADKAWTKDALAKGAPEGLKLVQTVKHRAWKSEDEARRVVLEKLGPDALELPTPAQAEKLGLEKSLVEGMTERPDGGPALAFASDKRATFARKSAAEMFQSVIGK